MDPYTTTRTTHPDSIERWTAAYRRAQDAGLMIRPGLFGSSLWTVTSKTRPDLCYAVSATVCGCAAAEHGDPVCQHRALFRAVTGQLPQVDEERLDGIFVAGERDRDRPQLGKVIAMRMSSEPRPAA